MLPSETSSSPRTYGELALQLEEHGCRETEASITIKLARGTFAATFLLAVAAALEMEMETIMLEDL